MHLWWSPLYLTSSWNVYFSNCWNLHFLGFQAVHCCCRSLFVQWGFVVTQFVHKSFSPLEPLYSNSNPRYGRSNLPAVLCPVPTIPAQNVKLSFKFISFARKHLFSSLLLVKAREIVQWDPFNITKRIFPDFCITSPPVFATAIH